MLSIWGYGFRHLRLGLCWTFRGWVRDCDVSVMGLGLWVRRGVISTLIFWHYIWGSMFFESTER